MTSHAPSHNYTSNHNSLRLTPAVGQRIMLLAKGYHIPMGVHRAPSGLIAIHRHEHYGPWDTKSDDAHGEWVAFHILHSKTKLISCIYHVLDRTALFPLIEHYRERLRSRYKVPARGSRVHDKP